MGRQGKILAIDHFGASAPYKTIYKAFGLSVENLVCAAEAISWKMRNKIMKKVIQPRLFNWDVAQTELVELFPAVWSAAEAITSPDIDLRMEGLACLEEMNAANYSPLVAYLVASRLVDPDLKVRARVIRLLGRRDSIELVDPVIDQQVHQHS